MNKYKAIHMLATVKSLFVVLFGNKYTLVILDTIITIVISIHTSNIDLTSSEWLKRLYLYVGISLLINLTCIWAEHLQNKQNKLLNYFALVYEIHSKLQSSTSTKLYRVNKKLTKTIREGELEKGEINSIADFQTLSFDICNEIHSFILDYFNCEDSEVTIFQRFTSDNSEFVTMIAYKNSQNRQPATYGQKFYLSQKKKNPLFVKIFKDINADIKVLHNKKAVKNEFSFFSESFNREQQICQYIGIPIRTNRNKVELLLQIDVSKSGTFGIRYKTVKKYAEEIFLPFATLLHCSYERDLILNKFYDVLEENISKKSRNHNEKTNN